MENTSNGWTISLKIVITVINPTNFTSTLFQSIIPKANNNVGGAATDNVFKILYIRELIGILKITKKNPVITATNNGFLIMFSNIKNNFLKIFDSFVLDAKKVAKVNNIIVSANNIILIGIAASSPNANIHNGIPKKP